MIEKKMHATIAQPNQKFSSKSVENEEKEKLHHTAGDFRRRSNDQLDSGRGGHEASPLHLLAIEGDKQALQVHLNSGKWDVNESDHMGRTPLMYSILGDQIECAALILKADADVDQVDIDERTPLHWASYQGNHKIVKLLINKGSKLNAKDAEQRTPLHLATTHDNIKVFQLLLKHMPRNQIDATDVNLMTALSWSVFYQRVEYTKLLLKYGASPYCVDKDHRSILHWTSKHEDAAILKILIQSGYTNYNWGDNKKRTLLHLAVAELNVPLVEFLLELPGVKVNEQDNMDRTPLHWAAILKGKELVSLLLQNNADYTIGDKRGIRALHYAVQSADIRTLRTMLKTPKIHIKDIPDSSKGTALMWAAVKGNVEIIELLLKHKCSDVGAVDEHGQTALHLCIQSGDIRTVRKLIEFGADVNAKDEKQHIPLFYACASGNKEIVRELVKHSSRVDLEDKDEDGRCTLHYAAMVDCQENLELLLDNNINPNLTDNSGRPPLHFAAYCGLANCMHALLEKGAKVDFEDNGKQTALHWACRSGSLAAVKLLVSRYNANVNVLNSSDNRLTPLDYAIVGDHQDVALYLTDNNASTGMYLREMSSTRIQALWRGYAFRKMNNGLIRRIKAAPFLEDKSLIQAPQIIPIAKSDSPVSTDKTVNHKEGGAESRKSQGWKHSDIWPVSFEKEGGALDNLLKNIQHTSKVPTEPAVSPIVGRRKSSNSILSGTTFSHRSSTLFLSPGSVKSDLKHGPKFPENSSLSRKGNEKRFSNPRIFFDQPNTESSLNAMKQNEWTTWKNFDRNMPGIPPANSRNSSSPTPSIIKVGENDASRRTIYSRHVDSTVKDSSSTTSGSSISTKLKNQSLTNLMKVPQTHQTPSLFSSLSNSDVTSIISTNDSESPWNRFQRDQKRIALIRKKTKAATKIQRAYRRHLRLKKFRRGFSRQERFSETFCESNDVRITEATALHEIHGASDVASSVSATTDDDCNEIPDNETLREVAALVIQLAFRGYLKRKLMSMREEKHMQSSESSVDERQNNLSEKSPIGHTEKPWKPKKSSKKSKDQQNVYPANTSSKEAKVFETQKPVPDTRKPLSSTTSFPLMQNVYRQSLKKKRNKKFSIKKKLLNLTATNNVVAIDNDTNKMTESPDESISLPSPSLRKPSLSSLDINELKHGKPKLFLSRRRSVDVLSSSQSPKSKQ